MKRLFPLMLILVAGLAIRAQTNCPEIKVIGPDSVTQPGEKMTFTAEVARTDKFDKLVYEWSVSTGIIIAGQGSATIDVQTTKDMASSNVTAVVRLSGVTEVCESNNASETASIADRPIIEPSDGFGRLKYNDLLPRIDSFYVNIERNRGSQGLIYVQVKDLGPQENRYLYSIYDALITLKKDLTKIRFAIEQIGENTEPRTTLWTFFSDGDIEHLISNTYVIKGTEFKRKSGLTQKPNTK